MASSPGAAAGPAATPGSNTGTFAALGHRTYRMLWIAGFVAFLSTFAQVIARGWLAHQLTGTNRGLGAVTLGFGLASLIATPLGGVVADRFPKRTVLVVSQLVLVASSVWIALAVELGFIRFWMLMVASALQAVGFAGTGPARMAFTAELVGPDLLSNAIVLSQLSLNANRVLGPSVAGVMIGIDQIGIGGVYVFGSVINLVALVLFARLPRGTPTGARRAAPLRELADGARYARSNRPALALLVLSTIVIMFGFPYVSFLPAVAEDVFHAGSAGYSWLSVTSAAGGIAVTLAIARRAAGAAAWRLVWLAGLGFAVSELALALSPSLVVASVAMFALGGTSAGFQSLTASLVLAHSDRAFHGRLQSLLQLGFSGFGLAALPLGLLADAAGLRRVLVGMAVVVALTTLIYEFTRTPVPGMFRWWRVAGATWEPQRPWAAAESPPSSRTSRADRAGRATAGEHQRPLAAPTPPSEPAPDARR
ncbi:MAG: MFS transporter [Acidimicrobiales bacterium]